MFEALRFARAPEGVVAGCSLRAGGVSEGPFASLNVSLAVGDVPAAVAENRRRLAAAAGFDLGRASVARQVHGADVAWIGADDAGRGLRDPDAAPVVDALATDVPGAALCVGVADCVPVALAAADGRAAALAHAGWRGVVADVVPRALEVLRARAGVAARDVVAAFGPSIGPCCFEVGPEVADVFRRRRPEAVVAGGARVDLVAALRASLAEAGVPDAPPRPPCTRCDPTRYFSHRAARGGPTGRAWAFVALPPRGAGRAQ